MDIFPYRYRGEQEEIAACVRTCVSAGGALVMESGTGTGKTVCSLAGALAAVKGTGKKIIYLTRTKSQQKQVVYEAAKISAKVPVICIAMQGRSSAACPMMRGDPELAGGSSEELSKLCSEYKKKGEDGRSSCPYYDNIENSDRESIVRMLREKHPTAEDFHSICAGMGMCSYELSKSLLPEADVIAVPYPFIFYPPVLSHFVQWTGTPLSSMVMIVDEAHNLPAYLREIMTVEYSSRSLELAEKEASAKGDPEIYKGLSVTDVTGVFRDCMSLALREHLKEEDGLLPYSFLRDEMMMRLGITSVSLDAVYKGLMELGEAITAEKKAVRKLPRSHVGAFGKFLKAWDLCDENTYVQLIVGGENPKFESFCLDPLDAAAPLRGCRASVSMSGTLEPLSGYSEELGLEDCTERVFPTPFPKENLKVIFAGDVTTCYDDMQKDPANYERLKDHTIRLVRSVRRNTAVFFPSYALMDRFIKDGVPELLDREVFYEIRGMPQSDLMETVNGFRGSGGSVLFCVTGGRISEGLDFPDKDLEMAILVGMPFPKPTVKHDALRRYCEYRFGDGWKYAVKIPTMRKMRQAIGRLIRSETDRGIAVILDRRASAMEGLGAEPASDLCSEAVKFFGETR